MRPEHSETKAKTETRECETEIETETETKNYETETETIPVKSIAGKSNTNRYVLFFITHMRWMINRKWILHLRWSVSEMFNKNNQSYELLIN